MPFKNEHSIRITQPTGYTKYRRGNLTAGVDAIFGIKNGKSSDHVSVGAVVQPVALKNHEEATDLEYEADELLDWCIDHPEVSLESLQEAMKHELEHTDNREIALKIACDHLEEHPDYYTKLAEMFKEYAEKTQKSKVIMHQTPITAYNRAKSPNEDDDDDEIDEEAFSAGTHTDSANQTETYSVKDLEEIAAKYNEHADGDPAPVCVGHPTDSSPAYGWIKHAYVAGDKLHVKIHKLNEAFKDALKKGAYRKRSLSLYSGGDMDKQIRHIGYLGAMPPAIRGLALTQTTFNSSAPFHIYEYKETDMSSSNTEVPVVMDEDKKKLAWYEKLFAKFKLEVKDFAADDMNLEEPARGDVKVVAMEKGDKADEESKEAKKGDDENEEIVKRETVDNGVLETSKVQAAQAKNDAEKANKELAELKSEVEKLKSELQAALGLVDKQKNEAVVGEYKAFCEGLIKDGLLRPADLETTLANFEARKYIDSIRDYASEGKPSAVEQLKKHLSSQPKVVEFNEVAVPPISSPEIPVPTASNLDEYIDKQIKDKLALTPNTSYADALRSCMREMGEKHPDMYREYVSRWTGKEMPPAKK
jgi:Protein of unknown function (DUF5661)